MLRTPLLLSTLAAATCTSLTRLSGLRGGAAPVQLIDSAGVLKPGAASEAVAGAAESLALVTSVGAQARGRKLLNELFDTEFDTAASDGGAWLAASSGLLLLATEGSSSEGPARSGADAGKLSSFSLALADAVLVHTPSTPSEAQLQASYESLFAQHLAGAGADEPKKVLLVHVGEGGEKAVRKACAQAWKVASAAAAAQPAAAFADSFELEVAPLPHAVHEAGEYAAALEALRARLRALPGSGLKAAGVGGAAEAAWDAACASVGAQPSDAAQCDRYLLESAYESAYSSAQATMAPWVKAVAAGKTVRGFGGKAAALLDGSLTAFAGGVADAAPGAAALATARSTKLRKALTNDVSALFAKQHKLLATAQLARYKARLLKVVARSGKLEPWQTESQLRACEKAFDAGVGDIFVPALNGPTKAQLNEAFTKQLTAAATAFKESPAMQLQAIGSMRRRTGKPQKQPRGVRMGVGLVGAVHSKMGGGQGNLQTFAGYSAGLNSAHFLFSNDGALPDSSGSEPDLLRFQPKLNFDIAI